MCSAKNDIEATQVPQEAEKGKRKEARTMAKKSGQLGRVLVLLDVLRHRTDDEHPLSVPALVAELEQRGVEIERKSVYAAVNALQERGYDVVLERGRGYHLGEREFQLAELKLLVDAVQASKFITVQKSQELIEKLVRQASDYQASSLQRQVYVAGKARSVNERVYYTIDAIYEAIAQDRQVSFHYFDYDPERQKVYRRGGAAYVVSPFALIRDNDNYYLVACETPKAPQAPESSEAEKEREEPAPRLRHYRVDKMEHIAVLEEPREGRKAFEAVDPGSYVDRHFGMFQGEEEEVVLRCKREMARVLIDRFGEDVQMIPDGENSVRAMVKVVVSPQFFGWIFGLEGAVEVLEPDSVRHKMRQSLRDMLGIYDPERKER
jgi:predicted DNA-binding transcriptional regulator YafY